MQIPVERFLIRLSDEIHGDILILKNDHIQENSSVFGDVPG